MRVGDLPANFVWGVATAAYQIEGGVNAEGRGASIWDTFSSLPGRTLNGDTGEVADNHYEHWRDDLDLMAQLGVDAYRFSIAWPRIQPSGRGPAQAQGLAFYDQLIDGLLERGITPWATLYHWDLPEALEVAGGWPERDTAERFADYAALVAENFGDRLRNIITLNEPWCSAFLGYGSGLHAPGRADPSDAVAAAHHLLLGHGKAVAAVRSISPGAQLGITLNLYPVHPAIDVEKVGASSPRSEPWLDAVRRVDGLCNRLFLDPLLKGGYPRDLLEDLADAAPPELIRPGDAETIAAPLDFLGVNYYTRHRVAPSALPGTNSVEFRVPDEPRTEMGWEIYPAGLLEVLRRLHHEYPAIPLVITENGAAFADVVAADGGVHDADRISYLKQHLASANAARSEGIPLEGYFAWSLLDNFEWAEGYSKRFGLVHVDYATQKRTIKDSGYWYSSLIRQHRQETQHR